MKFETHCANCLVGRISLRNVNYVFNYRYVELASVSKLSGYAPSVLSPTNFPCTLCGSATFRAKPANIRYNVSDKYVWSYKARTFG